MNKLLTAVAIAGVFMSSACASPQVSGNGLYDADNEELNFLSFMHVCRNPMNQAIGSQLGGTAAERVCQLIYAEPDRNKALGLVGEQVDNCVSFGGTPDECYALLTDVRGYIRTER